jgi:predicted deacylase
MSKIEIKDQPRFASPSRLTAASIILSSLLLVGCGAIGTKLDAANDPISKSDPPAFVSEVDTNTQSETPARSASSTPSATPLPTLTPTPFLRGPIVIGQSVAGRPLEVFQFGSGGRKHMIIAGIHGGYEGNTIRLADQLIAILPSRPDLFLEDVTLYILRALNPDGEVRSDSYKGRVNENLVDLNRNWPAQWESEWPKQGCWTYTYVTGGSHPASEPETRALMNFLLTYEIEALISYHSAALGIFPGGQPPDASSISLAETLDEVSDYPYPPIETGCTYTGQLIDWASIQGIASVDIELTNHEDSDLRQNLDVLEAFLHWEKPPD